ncbi:MAG: DHH family phosphoesterase [Clostridiales bacterium]|nr:DHH family phosphoesterase [Clostridiales bacterium]
MKYKNKWSLTPYFLIFSGIMLFFAIASFKYSKLLFALEILLVAASVLAVLISALSMKKYISKVTKIALKGMNGTDRKFLQGFGFPVAITGIDGDIVWTNEAFANLISYDHTPHGEYITNYLGSNSIRKAFSSDGLNVSAGTDKFTVFASRTESGVVFYFFNDTELKDIREKYIATRPCVASIVFDNREEFERDENTDTLNSVLAPLESALIKWANNYNGSFRHISGGKYTVVFEEDNFSKIINSNFDILDEIRSIKSSAGTAATVSIGVGTGGDSFKECDAWSKKALEMALGRGGDQAVIKNENDFSFYGGISQGVERHNKVRSRVYAAAISEKIKESDRVFIMGHNFSDLDCIGAAAGLYAIVNKMGKKACIVVKAAQSPALPLISSLEKTVKPEMFSDPAEAVKNINDKSLLIIVDTHSSAFLESTELYLKAKNVIVIDHHRMMVNHIANAAVFYQETFASSACEMVSELVQYMDESAITKPIAEALMSGIMLDTKNFTVKTGSRTFEASAFLSSKSADTIAVKQLFANTLDDYKAKCELVFNSELYGNCAVATTTKQLKNIRVVAAQAADEMLNIQNVDASYVVFPIDGGISISARSLGKVNVQLVMESMGGGGHHTMAAVQLKDVSVEQGRDLLLEKIDESKLS